MATREVPKDEWQEFCDSFSRLHEGWLADVQVTGDQTGQRFESKGRPFRGVSYDDKGSGKDQLSVFIDQSPKDDLTHTVTAPTHIRVDQTETGADQGLEVESQDGTKTIVRFKDPGRPDAVDRM